MKTAGVAAAGLFLSGCDRLDMVGGMGESSCNTISFYDDFYRADGEPGNGWTVDYSGNNSPFKMRILNFNAYANAVDGVTNNSNLLRPILYNSSAIYRFRWRANAYGVCCNVGNSWFGFLCPNNTMETSGLTFYTNFWDHTSGTFSILLNGTNLLSTAYTYSGVSTWFDIKIDIPNKKVYYKYWADGASEPDYSTITVAYIPVVAHQVGFKYSQNVLTSDLTIYEYSHWIYNLPNFSC